MKKLIVVAIMLFSSVLQAEWSSTDQYSFLLTCTTNNTPYKICACVLDILMYNNESPNYVADNEIFLASFHCVEKYKKGEL